MRHWLSDCIAISYHWLAEACNSSLLSTSWIPLGVIQCKMFRCLLGIKGLAWSQFMTKLLALKWWTFWQGHVPFGHLLNQRGATHNGMTILEVLMKLASSNGFWREPCCATGHGVHSVQGLTTQNWWMLQKTWWITGVMMRDICRQWLSWQH